MQGTYKTYHLDGDKDFDEEGLKMARMGLFTHPQLQRQLEAYWRLSVGARICACAAATVSAAEADDGGDVAAMI